jgi:hypothetical protein
MLSLNTTLKAAIYVSTRYHEWDTEVLKLAYVRELE